MRIAFASLCKQGGREYNQDFLATSVNGCEACLVVCDGLGSYIGSEIASQLCAMRIIDMYEKVREMDSGKAVSAEAAQTFIHSAHAYVSEFKNVHPEIRSSCTTVSCFITDGSESVISHIGDTRTYLFRNNKLAFQTKDHSLSQLAVEMGQIKLRDIRTHKDQNKLTRVLGNDYYVDPDIHCDHTPLECNDAVIICSDGFWEYVYEEEMEADLASSPTPEEALAKMEARLLSRINKFNDNYSAIVAKVVND